MAVGFPTRLRAAACRGPPVADWAGLNGNPGLVESGVRLLGPFKGLGREVLSRPACRGFTVICRALLVGVSRIACRALLVGVSRAPAGRGLRGVSGLGNNEEAGWEERTLVLECEKARCLVRHGAGCGACGGDGPASAGRRAPRCEL